LAVAKKNPAVDKVIAKNIRLTFFGPPCTFQI